MQTKTLQQTVTFKASPQEVYDMLMDSKKTPVVIGRAGQDQQEGGWQIHSMGISFIRHQSCAQAR